MLVDDTHKVDFNSPVGSMVDELTSTESSVHASKTPKLLMTPTDDSFSNIFFPTAIIWKQVDTGFLHIGLI